MSFIRTLASGASSVALALSLGLAAAPAMAQNGPAEGWGFEETDVEPDANIRYGTLENGMRYAIRFNDTPDDAASVRLHFDFGSLAEADNERGLAHFIEHMAFNGSTNVAEGEMIPLLERHGLSFGADTNASTGFDETIYKLDVPNVNGAALDTALMLMRETASELLFTEEAVNREREVIVNERRARDTVGLRGLVDYIGFVGPDTIYTQRLPIGTDEVLRTAPAERLRALYRRYYRPEYATLVVVGDFDVDAMEADIRERFGDWEAVGEAGGPPDVGLIDLTRASAIDTFIDPATSSVAQIIITRPYDDPADTQADRRLGILDNLAAAMVARRFEQLAQQENSPLLGGSFGTDILEPAARISSMTVNTRDGAWQIGLAAAEQQLRRALQFGFTQPELDMAMANLGSAYRTAAEQADARTSRQLAESIVDISAAENDIVTDPLWRYALFQSLEPSLTLDAVNTRFRELWTGSPPLIRITAKELDGGDEAIAAVLSASAQVAVAAPQDSAVAEFAYGDFGTPGTLTSDTMIEDLGIRTVSFANNVRLNIKQTDFEPGRVRYQVRMAGGQFALGETGPGDVLLLQVAGDVAGTRAHSLQELQQIVAGRQVGLGFNAGTDSFLAGGSTTSADLELQMQLAAAYLTDAGFRPEGQARYDGIIDAVWGQVMSQPGVVKSLAQGALLTDDPAFAFPTREMLDAVSLAAIEAPYRAAAADAAIEIAIVGDIDPDAAIAAVASTFGALDERQADFPDYAEQRQIAFRELGSDEPTVVTHTGPADQAVVAALWRTDDDADYRAEVTMNLLSSVIDLLATETLREELAATYSPSVASEMSADYDGWGVFEISAIVAPETMDEVSRAIDGIIERVRSEPVDEDYLLRARQPLLENLRQALEDNGFWLGVAATAQSDAERLDRVREQEELLRAITPADLQAAAQRYLTDARRAELYVVPQSGAGGDAAGSATSGDPDSGR